MDISDIRDSILSLPILSGMWFRCLLCQHLSVSSSAHASKAKEVPRRVRVLIADDHPVVKKMVRSLLEEYPHIEVCGEAADGLQAIEEAQKLKPDVVVLNVTMPIMSGFQAARVIKKRLPQAAIVILSANADQGFVEEARKIGVHAYVAKSKAGEALVRAVEEAIKGEDFYLVE